MSPAFKRKATLAPMLSVRNGVKALEFYQAAFGAEISFLLNDGGAVVAQLTVQGAEFWLADESPEHFNFSPESLGGSTLRIIFTVPESAMAFFPRGAKLELSTTDYPHLRQPASVFRVSPVVDRASDSVEVIGNLEKPSPLLKPGMSMQVKLSPR